MRALVFTGSDLKATEGFDSKWHALKNHSGC
jgi:hypothetical protein